MYDDDPSNNGRSCHLDSTGEKRVMDVVIRFYDHYSRTFDSLKRSIDPIRTALAEHDLAVNNGIGHVDDRVLTHGISQGASNTGVYGVKDLLYNPTTQEYLAVNKLGEIFRYDWAGEPLPKLKPSTKPFTNFIHIRQNNSFITWITNKTGFTITNSDFIPLASAVSTSPIKTIIHGDRNSAEEGIQFFIISLASLLKYLFNPTTNTVTLQDVLIIADIQAEKTVIESFSMDQPQGEKKQWIYLTFNKHCAIIDVTGRTHGTKKNLHDTKITAILAIRSSEYIVTGDDQGELKLWGNRWAFLASIKPHTSRITHIIMHPGGHAVVSIGRDKLLHSWNFETRQKLEVKQSTEIVERVASNPDKQAFMTQGPRKLIIWRMDELFFLQSQLNSPITNIQMTWHPDYPKRAIVTTQDRAIRLINPHHGHIITTALIGSHNPAPAMHILASAFYPVRHTLYVLAKGITNPGSVEIEHHDTNFNPCKFRDKWRVRTQEVSVTALAYFEYLPSYAVPEKEFAFSLFRQKETYTQKTCFLIIGRSDGNLCKMDLKTGAVTYMTPCHKAQVDAIHVCPELSQFISAGTDPGFRLWKSSLKKEEEFIPLLDITWKHPIRHICITRELIGFALTHPDLPAHKFIIFNNLEGERYDHRKNFAHSEPIVSVSGNKDLLLFCTASLDETIRIWSEKNDLVRVLCLNWIPQFAAFVTPQGDIYVGIDNNLNVIPANMYLTVVYRNRALMGGFDSGSQEVPVSLNSAKSGQDPRMYVALENEMETEEEKTISEKNKPPAGAELSEDEQETHKTRVQRKRFVISPVEIKPVPRDSQRAKDNQKLAFMREDLMLIVAGKHPFSTTIPDPHTMSKKQWDEFGKSIFPETSDDRKFFVSEAREGAAHKMNEAKADLGSYDTINV